MNHKLFFDAEDMGRLITELNIEIECCRKEIKKQRLITARREAEISKLKAEIRKLEAEIRRAGQSF